MPSLQHVRLPAPGVECTVSLQAAPGPGRAGSGYFAIVPAAPAAGSPVTRAAASSSGS